MVLLTPKKWVYEWFYRTGSVLPSNIQNSFDALGTLIASDFKRRVG